MRRSIVGTAVTVIAIVGLVIATGPSAVAAPGTRSTIIFDLGGFTIDCPTHTYTFTPGSRSAFNLYTHQSASGNTVSLLTPNPSGDVHLVDENGATYTIRGVIVSSTTSAATGETVSTYVAKLPIVADHGGGISDIDNLIIHTSRNGDSFSFQFGTCEFD